ncbi:MAG: hypothetical protein DA328_08735 [Nitrososphaeraceae archaeon]|nr:hypothetical protein [Nitrososphaeraceae archaeon]
MPVMDYIQSSFKREIQILDGNKVYLIEYKDAQDNTLTRFGRVQKKINSLIMDALSYYNSLFKKIKL